MLKKEFLFLFKVFIAISLIIFIFGCSRSIDFEIVQEDVELSDTNFEARGCRSYSEPIAKGTIPEELKEVSGISASSKPGVLWMHNDSGSKPLLYAVDVESGSILATVTIEVDLTLDWESMSAGPCSSGSAARCLFIGDIGDNGGIRKELGVSPQVHRIPEPDPTGGDQSVSQVETMLLSYPDGVSHNAEALVTDGQGRIFVLTKDEGNLFHLFGAVFKPRDVPVKMSDYGEFDLSPWLDGAASKVTAADFDIETNRLLVRHWQGILEYALPLEKDLTSLQEVVPYVVPSADEKGQGEAVAYGGGGYYQVAEGINSPIYFIACGDSH